MVNKLTNVLIFMPYMFLQSRNNDRAVLRESASSFMQKIIEDRYEEIKIHDFFKKSKRVDKKLARMYDFQRRIHKRADEAFLAGDYSKAMASLMMIDRKVSTRQLINAAKESLPKRVRSIYYKDQRIDMSSKVEVDLADSLVDVNSVKQKIRALKKGRSPGIDGFTAEHLISLTSVPRSM